MTGNMTGKVTDQPTGKCVETEAHLFDAIDGKLEVFTEARLAAHLATCGACQAKVELWRSALPGMRQLAPAPPSDLNARRMQMEIVRQLQFGWTSELLGSRRGHHDGLFDDDHEFARGGRFGQLRERLRHWSLRAVAALTLSLTGVAVAAGVSVWWYRSGAAPLSTAPADALYATVMRTEGDATSGGRRLVASSRLFAGSEVDVGVGGEAELLMDRGSVLRVFGPARLLLDGNPRAVALRLEEGTIQADVLHRTPGETFAVITHDLRVEVRGTRFTVGTGHPGGGAGGGGAGGRGWVRVQEGLVAVHFPRGGHRLVGEGELATAPVTVPDGTEDQTAAAAPVGPPAALAVAPGPAAARPAGSRDTDHGERPRTARAPATSCASALHLCQAAARGARDSMRVGRHDRALRTVVAAATARAASPGDGARATCGNEGAACQDELRYLRAEALRGTGRIDEAVAAYRSLNRPGAPAAMRQNAFYAAAELERRAGRLSDALADYDRALAAAPHGALYEEALVGSVDTADLLGDHGRAAALARRYLNEFPGGRGAANARRLMRLVDGQPRP